MYQSHKQPILCIFIGVFLLFVIHSVATFLRDLHIFLKKPKISPELAYN